ATEESPAHHEILQSLKLLQNDENITLLTTSKRSNGCAGYFPAFEFEAHVEVAVAESLAAFAARDGAPVTASAREGGFAVRAGVLPARFARWQCDVVTRSRLAELPGFSAEFG